MEYSRYLQTNHWKKTRADKIAAKLKCQVCDTENNLNVHHKHYKNRDGDSLLFNEKPGNLIVLCRSCHSLWHRYCHNVWLKKKMPKNNKKILIIRRFLSFGVVRPWAFRLVGMGIWWVAKGKLEKFALEHKIYV